MTTILAFLFYSCILLLDKLTQESIKPSPKICEEPSEQACPTCGSEHLIKNGSVHNGKPKYQCKTCGRQFVISPTKTTVSEETKQLIDRLLLERISLPWNCQGNSGKLVLVTRLCESKTSSDSASSKGFSQTNR